MVIGFTLLGIKEILFSKRGIDKTLELLVFGFMFGYRTFDLIPGLPLHPIEVFIYCAILRIIITSPIKYRQMSTPILIMSIFFILFLIIDVLTRYHPYVFNEFKNTFLLTLIFYISQYIFFTKSYLINLLKKYVFTSTVISTLGICEYLYPSYMASVFGYEMTPDPMFNSLFFNRLAFLFWGSHLAANLIPPLFPILLLLKADNNSITKNNYFLTSIILINLFAIYLSGNRISWLILTILLSATIFQYRSSLIPYLKTYALIVTAVFVVYIYSQPVEGRYLSTFKAMSGNIDSRYDSSSAARLKRANTAIDSIIKYPFGTGWWTQGWVHSDILQVSASIGIIPGILLLFSPLYLLLKLFNKYSIASPELQSIYFSLCGLVTFVIISLSLNGSILLVQCGTPLFLFWAVSDGYLKSNV